MKLLENIQQQAKLAESEYPISEWDRPPHIQALIQAAKLLEEKDKLLEMMAEALAAANIELKAEYNEHEMNAAYDAAILGCDNALATYEAATKTKES